MFKLFPNYLAIFALVMANQVFAEIIDGEELVDPTRPFIFKVVGDDQIDFLDRFVDVVPSSFEVTFVRVGSSSSMAVVNDQRVTVGDVIGGAEVIAIDRSGVTLLIDDQERRIRLYGTNVKAPAIDR